MSLLVFIIFNQYQPVKFKSTKSLFLIKENRNYFSLVFVKLILHNIILLFDEKPIK